MIEQVMHWQYKERLKSIKMAVDKSVYNLLITIKKMAKNLGTFGAFFRDTKGNEASPKYIETIDLTSLPKFSNLPTWQEKRNTNTHRNE